MNKLFEALVGENTKNKTSFDNGVTWVINGEVYAKRKT